jgi:flagellar basal-body rod modification protein FlgD
VARPLLYAGARGKPPRGRPKKMDTVTVDPILSSSQTAAQAQAATASVTPALGKEDFMKLLLAQLEHQDPMNPQDDAQFVSQLATFSSLEQLQTANGNLETLALGQSNLINSQALNLIGKNALVESGDTVHVKGGVPDSIVYSLPQQASSATLTIFGPDGAPVRTFDLDKTATGRINLAWDGTDSNGKPLADGDYRIEVSATNLDGAPMTVSLFQSLSIDGVNFGGTGISLVSADREIPFDSIVEIRAGE